jgi:hypothetical protein
VSKVLSAGRRDGVFPELDETVRQILVPPSGASPERALVASGRLLDHLAGPPTRTAT